MASKVDWRSISFKILAHASPGDGDSLISAENASTIDDPVEIKSRRRRKKSKSRKTSGGDSISADPAVEGLSSVPPTNLLERRALKGSLHGVGVNSPLSGWQDGFSPTGSSAFTPAYSTDSPLPGTPTPRPADSGASLREVDFRLMEFPNGNLNGDSASELLHGDLREGRLLSLDAKELQQNLDLHEGRLLPEDAQESQCILEERASQSTESTSYNIVTGNDTWRQAQRERHGSSDGVLKSEQRLPYKLSGFLTGVDSLDEPALAPASTHPSAELRQRIVGRGFEDGEQGSSAAANGGSQQIFRENLSQVTSPTQLVTPPASKTRQGTFATPQLKEWQHLMSNSSQCPRPLQLSPMQYFVSEIYSGSTLRNTTSGGTEQKREKVYNTMFHVPWRCELLIDVGFFVCLDAFLSLFTVMPARIGMFIWHRLTGFIKGRQFQRPFAAELCDFGCLLVLVVGVAVLMQADISIIYHWIRGQGVIKLYVVFNVLEIFDKLCQSFGADVLQLLFNSAVSVEICKSESLSKEMVVFALDQCIAIFTYFVHSLVIISQAITISAAVNAQNNALLTLLISNNFAEIKSNVFKRMGTDQLHKMAYHDTVERFHIMTHVLFVWAQNVLNGEDSLWLKLFYNAGMVFLCEVFVDVIKHSFLAKFNEVKPAVYSEFLQALCSQTLNSGSHEIHKTLSFVPLAPACVVMRILLPVYASCIPEGPSWWRWPIMLLLAGLTYSALVLSKMAVGLGLQSHASWYLKRHPWTRPHPHFE